MMPAKINGKVPFRDRLKTAKLAERTVSVCLRGDLWAEIQRKDAELRALEPGDTDRLVGNPEATRLATDIEALRRQMREETEEFTLRAISAGEWTKLAAAHPPRKDNEQDKGAGFNRDDFFEALVRRCTVSPELDDADWDALIDVVNGATWDALTNTAWLVNKGEVSVPFSLAASKVLRSDTGSKRQND